jgi:hypothetical protein
VGGWSFQNLRVYFLGLEHLAQPLTVFCFFCFFFFFALVRVEQPDNPSGLQEFFRWSL